jgi:hypothetical protein
MSVGDGFMIAMAAESTDTTTVTSGDDVVARRRGRSKAPNFTYGGPVSVIRLQLDVSDERLRRRVQRQWSAAFRLRRALQRDAAARCRAYWAARHERGADPRGLRARLGLSRKGIEAAARAHIEASGWMRDHLTKAVGLHLADEVWQTVDRHLFADASGRRHGPPRIGSWWDFTRIPGRARSHTKATPVWETYRLVGTLDGHLQAYRHPQLPASVSTAVVAATRPAGTSILAQPARMPAPARPATGSWWDHSGALAVVFTGLPGGDEVLPVRLPHGAGQWARLRHFLADPAVWHKIDLVRVRDGKAPGGWRYYAHLLIHRAGYQAPASRSRRAQIPAGRRAGSMRTCRTWRWPPSPAGIPNSWPSSRSPVTPPSSRRRRGQLNGRGIASAPWIAPGAPPMPTSTVRRSGSTSGRNAEPSTGWPPARSPTRAGPGPPVPMGCRCAPTATTGSRVAIGASAPITPLRPVAPVRPNAPARARSRPASSPPTATPSPSRTVRSPPGRADGARGLPCSVPACWWPPSNANAKPPAARCVAPAPDPPRFPSTACAGRGCRKPSPSAPMTAHTVDCAVTVTSSPPPWRPVSSSPTPTIRARRGSITDLPTPCGRGWPPSKSGRAQSTGTSHHHHQMLDRPGPAATTRWPLLSTQHSAHPRTAQAHGLDVAGPAENNQLPS